MAWQVSDQAQVPCPHCGQMVPLTRHITSTGRTTATGQVIDVPQAEYRTSDGVHDVRNERALGIEEPIVIVVRCRLHERGN